MYLLYLDDSGSATNLKEEYLVLGGQQMIGRQDETLDAIQDLGNKQDNMLEKQDQTLVAIKDMDKHLNDKFDWLAERYGEFGEKMGRLEEDIHEMKDAFVRLTEHYINGSK